MHLEFNNEWRISPPEDGKYANKSIPPEALREFHTLIAKVTTQGDLQTMLEHFKEHFSIALGTAHNWSSGPGWAETDLHNAMEKVSKNAPLFIEAIYDAFRTLKTQNERYFVPTDRDMNSVFNRYGIGYQIANGKLLLRKADIALVKVSVIKESLDERGIKAINKSLSKAESLLSANDGKGAIQETLWLLETIITLFRGASVKTRTIVGKYFSQIVKELKTAQPSTNLRRILDWAESLYGFLSSPTGGGVRHGMDINAGQEPSVAEARLYVNLIRSYIDYLIAEHARLSKQEAT